MPTEITKREVVVLMVRHPVPHKHVGGLTPPLRPTTDHPAKRREPEKVRSSLPVEVEIDPLLDLSPGKRLGENGLELGHPTLTGGVIQPKPPTPRRLPIPEVSPDFGKHPPQIGGSEHVQRAPHGPGSDDLTVTDGIVDILPRQPNAPHPHRKPIGPNILPLKRDDPRHSSHDGAGPITPDPVGIRPRGPHIHEGKVVDQPATTGTTVSSAVTTSTLTRYRATVFRS